MCSDALQIADEFVKRFSDAVDALKIGLPWHAGVNITPLPEPNKPAFLQELIADAVRCGACNKGPGGGAGQGHKHFDWGLAVRPTAIVFRALAPWATVFRALAPALLTHTRRSFVCACRSFMHDAQTARAPRS